MTQIRARRGSTAAWAAANPVLADGEPGWDNTLEQLKMGNGVDPWSVLPYVNTPGGATDLAATTHAAGSKSTPVDADETLLVDS